MAEQLCICCGRGLSGGRTREHVIPEWLLEHLDLNLETFYQQVMSTSEGEVLKQRQHEMQAFVYSRICEECNNGWMSDLENEAKTLLVPLIEGERTAFQLTGAEKLLFAKWSCKTAYIL